MTGTSLRNLTDALNLAWDETLKEYREGWNTSLQRNGTNGLKLLPDGFWCEEDFQRRLTCNLERRVDRKKIYVYNEMAIGHGKFSADDNSGLGPQIRKLEEDIRQSQRITYKRKRFSPDIAISHVDNEGFEVFVEVKYYPAYWSETPTRKSWYEEAEYLQKIELARLATKNRVCKTAYFCALNDLYRDRKELFETFLKEAQRSGVIALIDGVSLHEKQEMLPTSRS